MINNCPVCERHVHKIEFRRQGYEYKHCKVCDTLFVANTLNTNDIYEHYDENYYEARDSNSKRRSGYTSYLAIQDSLKSSFENKLEFIRRKMRSGRLLDVGAAYGAFIQKAAGQYDCFGVEISRYAAKTAQKINQARIATGNIEQAPFASDQFDIITMWDVIEHLMNPVAALSQASRLLKTGGFCFIGTDDLNNWLVKMMGKKWWSIAPPLHLCHFSRNSIKMAVQRAGGFEICEIIKDQRLYKLNEIMKYFGNSYQNDFLLRLGNSIERSRIGQVAISIKRPEQFILILRKQT